MNSVQFCASAPRTVGAHATITRTGPLQWQAVEDGTPVGEGEASRRSDGRVVLAVDTWHGAVFDRLAAAMVSGLRGPILTVVDEADADLVARWERAGLTVRRREVEYAVATGVHAVPRPPGVTVLGPGTAREPALRAVAEAVHAEIDAGPGRGPMPLEMPPHPAGAPMDTSRYTVAEVGGRYVGLVRVVGRRRHARIGLVAVREHLRRRGVARAMLAEVLGTLHRDGVTTASAEVDERNDAAAALFAGFGARPVGGVLEIGRDA